MSTVKVAINGFGRIGRLALRAALKHGFHDIQIVPGSRLARLYPDGAVLGRALQGVPRGSYYLATKVGQKLFPEHEATLIAELIRALAEYEKLAHEVTASEADLREGLFGREPRCHCDLAFWNGSPAGFALWFYNFSTFAGKAGIYLEDLFVASAARRNGVGEALIQGCAEFAKSAGSSRLYWQTQRSNESAQRLYNKVAKLSEYIIFEQVFE